MEDREAGRGSRWYLVGSVASVFIHSFIYVFIYLFSFLFFPPFCFFFRFFSPLIFCVAAGFKRLEIRRGKTNIENRFSWP